MKIYAVGGMVRDMLSKIPCHDRDFVVEASFDDMREHILSIGCSLILEKPQYLTIRAKTTNNEVVDFATCRLEADYDGRRPSSVNPASIHEDLARRDFTVNAMAMEVDQDFQPLDNLIDPFGGKIDLHNKLLKFVGDPQERLEEDGLRWLRAIRFMITKDLVPSNSTNIALMNATSKILTKVRTNRIKDELEKCFKYSTSKTITHLERYPKIWERDELWFLPTTKDK